MTKDDLLVFEKQRELWVPSELQTIGCEKPELWVQIQSTVIICSLLVVKKGLSPRSH
jgi:hypothetical protein